MASLETRLDVVEAQHGLVKLALESWVTNLKAHPDAGEAQRGIGIVQLNLRS